VSAMATQSEPLQTRPVADKRSVRIHAHFASQVGDPRVEVRCGRSRFPLAGHVSHIASLEGKDILWAEEPDPPRRGRLWIGSDGRAAMAALTPGLQPVWTRTFAGGGETAYTLVLCERER
jgi:hypothetical protein